MEYKMKVDETSLQMDNYEMILDPCVGLVLKVLDLEAQVDSPIHLADFGTCVGQTFLPFLKLLIENIRRWSKSREIVVTLNDQPTNDFNGLVRNITAFQREMNDPLLRMCITPGNVYGQCLPNTSIDFGVCSFVLQWLSEPVQLDNNLFYIPGKTRQEEEVKRISAQDWLQFLLARTKEMKKGSAFLVNVPIGASKLYSIASFEFYKLYEENIISQEELCNTSIPINPFRTEDGLRAPFKERKQELGVQLLHLSKRLVKCYENKDIAGGLKSWMHYSVAAGLSKTRKGQEVQEICDIYFQNLKQRFSDWKSIDIFICDVLFQKL